MPELTPTTDRRWWEAATGRRTGRYHWHAALIAGLLCIPIDMTASAKHIALPAPVETGSVSVEEAIRLRRSVRDFRRASLSLQEIAQLLWATQGITDPRGLRAAPSAGALYPLEVYLVAGEVDGVQPGIYHYRPQRHELVRTVSGDQRAALAAAALGQEWVRAGAAALVLTGIYRRTEVKYGDRAERYVHVEAGHAAENAFLQAVALGLGAVVVGAFDDLAVRNVMQLPGGTDPLVIMPLGRPR